MSETEAKLMRALHDVLGEGAVGAVPDTAFFDLGMDSIDGLRFARRAQDETGIEIDPEWLFDHSSIGALARFLDAMHAMTAPPVT